MKGQIIKAVGKFTVKLDSGEVIKAFAKGKIKTLSDITVGDNVEVNGGVIERVEERKNRFLRPNVSNVDLIAVLAAKTPEPDFYLIDKLLISAEKQNVPVIFILNKSDENGGEFENTFIKQYGKFYDIISVSAKTGENLDKLSDFFSGKLVVLCGQSAVGKSSVISALTGSVIKVGEVSKINRGKNTTVSVNLYPASGYNIIDSPGFSVAEVDIKADEIKDFYKDFEGLDNCRYRDCNHINEPDCAVKKAVKEGKINKDRYDRYVELFNAQKEIEKYVKR